MTDHEMLLLRAAVEAAQADGALTYLTVTRGVNDTHYATSPDHLTALLADLGADVPEWPSEKRVAEIRVTLADGDWDTTDLPLPEYLALRGGS